MQNAMTGNKRLLVISYHFPPDGAVGGLRWSGLSKYLARRNWEVHIVTAGRRTSAAQTPGVTVHYCARRTTLNDVYVRVVRRLRGRKNPAGKPSQPPEATAPSENGRALRSLRREISSLLDFPDFARGWILRSSSKARQLLAQARFDAVVTTGPPHAAHLAGVLATLGRPEPLVADFRDPWSHQLLWETNPSTIPWLYRRVIPRLERLVWRRASRIITNTREFRDQVGASGAARSVHFLPNGVDQERLPGPTDKLYEGFSIAYVGTLYMGRDFSPVFKAMRLFAERHAQDREQLRLRVAGTMDGQHGQLFHEQMKSAGVTDMVEVHGLLPNQQAIDLLNRSHLALVLAQNQPLQIPAKLYECLGMCIPTLVISESNSAAAKEARRLGAYTCENDDIQGISEVIEQVRRSGGVRQTPRSSIDYEDLAGELDDILQDTLTKAQGLSNGRLSDLSDSPA
jgi:glycosyltransferase involved in cell wall biosynthesis